MACNGLVADDFTSVGVARTAHFVSVQRDGHFRRLDDGAAWIDGGIESPSADDLRDHFIDQDIFTVG